MSLAKKRVVLAWLGAGVLAAVACAGGPSSPSTSTAASSLATTASGTLAASGSPRSGDLHVTKDCSSYAGKAGDSCTVRSSNLDAIEVDSTVTYAQAADFSTFTLDSDVVLNPPKPGNNRAFGHCHLNLATGVGLCTFSGGTGKFTHFQASANVSRPKPEEPIFAWDGTYSLSPQK
jgi:hypothetical protein